jgi:hypothetical protein
MRTSIICLLALLLSVAGASHSIAQNIKAALNGRVLDTQNNLVANAAVTVIDTQRGQQRTVVSDTGGAFHLPGLEPGTYRVVVNVSGFAPYESAEINLRVGDAPNFDVRLQLSQVTSGSLKPIESGECSPPYSRYHLTPNARRRFRRYRRY